MVSVEGRPARTAADLEVTERLLVGYGDEYEAAAHSDEFVEDLLLESII